MAESVRFSMYTVMSSANNDSFASSFPTWMPFISFSCLIAGARTSNTMLRRSSESRHPCLVPDFSGKAFRFCPLSMMAVSFSNMAFIILMYALCIPTLLSVFYHKWLIKCFFCIYAYGHMTFVLPFVYVMHYVY